MQGKRDLAAGYAALLLARGCCHLPYFHISVRCSHIAFGQGLAREQQLDDTCDTR